MKAFIIITLAFLTIPLGYLTYLNLNSSGVFVVDNFASSNSEHNQIVVLDTSSIFVVENSVTNQYELSVKNDSKLKLGVNKANLKDFFKNWSEVSQGTFLVNLQPPTGCRYMNMVLILNAAISQNIENNLERVYCSAALMPNLTLIP